MPTLYDAAMRNFRAAADILESLQSSRIDLLGEARRGLIGRPRFVLKGGYNDVTPSFGACLPAGGRAEMLAMEGGAGVELRSSSADWLTLEGALTNQRAAEFCYVEIQVTASDRPLIADLFLREFVRDGSICDSDHQECHINEGDGMVCRLALREIDENVTGRRVIISLRHPAARLVLDRLSVILT